MIANPTKASQFPAMLWNQKTGESRVFERAEDVPAGYLDHYPTDAEKAEAPEPASPNALPMTREEIIAALKQGGIKFKGNASAAVLYAQLTDAVHFALTEAKVEFNPESPTPDLLKLLAPKEGAGAQ